MPQRDAAVSSALGFASSVVALACIENLRRFVGLGAPSAAPPISPGSLETLCHPKGTLQSSTHGGTGVRRPSFGMRASGRRLSVSACVPPGVSPAAGLMESGADPAYSPAYSPANAEQPCAWGSCGM